MTLTNFLSGVGIICGVTLMMLGWILFLYSHKDSEFQAAFTVGIIGLALSVGAGVIFILGG